MQPVDNLTNAGGVGVEHCGGWTWWKQCGEKLFSCAQQRTEELKIKVREASGDADFLEKRVFQ